MTQQLIEIIERVKTWPAWRQDDAEYLLEMMEETGKQSTGFPKKNDLQCEKDLIATSCRMLS